MYCMMKIHPYTFLQMEELLRILMRSPDPEWTQIFLDILREAKKYGNIVENIERTADEIKTGK